MKKLAIIVSEFANNEQNSLNVIGNYIKKILKKQGYGIYYENQNTFCSFLQLENQIKRDSNIDLSGLICFAGSDFLFNKNPETYVSLKKLTDKNIKSFHIISFNFKEYLKQLQSLEIYKNATIYKTELHSQKFIKKVNNYFNQF